MAAERRRPCALCLEVEELAALVAHVRHEQEEESDEREHECGGSRR